MKTPQIIVIAGAIALLAVLYFFGNTIKPQGHEGHNHSHTGPFDFNQMKINALGKLDANAKTQVASLDGKEDTASLNALALIYAKAKEGNMSAFYKGKAAKLENTEKSLTFAAQFFTDLLAQEADSNVRKWQATQALTLLDNALRLNPNSEVAKTLQGVCYTDGTGETMKGVLQLKDIGDKNPKNLTANITLARLAITSGQWDKAIARLEKLFALYPDNVEVLSFLAEGYKGKGNTQKAKQLFEKSKQIVNNPEYSKEIDAYIKTF
jgi:tetratricopeptide (TPR) repeat protein